MQPNGETAHKGTGSANEANPASVKKLEDVYNNITVQAEIKGKYYGDIRDSSRWGSTICRLLAVILAGIGAVLPVVTETYTAIQPIIATLLLALAGLLILIDQQMGLTTGWNRCKTAQVGIDLALNHFKLEWLIEQTSWGDVSPTSAEAARVLRLADTLQDKIDAIVAVEMSGWTSHIQAAYQQMEQLAGTVRAQQRANAERIDQEAQERPAAETRGRVDLTVDNGDECEAPWTVSVDTTLSEQCTGKTAELVLDGGYRQIKVTGKIGGEDKRALKAWNVIPGELATVQVTLS